jgi:hypothetical protein
MFSPDQLKAQAVQDSKKPGKKAASILILLFNLGFPECRYFHKAGFSFW